MAFIFSNHLTSQRILKLHFKHKFVWIYLNVSYFSRLNSIDPRFHFTFHFIIRNEQEKNLIKMLWFFFRKHNHGFSEVLLYPPVMRVNVKHCPLPKCSSTTWQSYFAQMRSYMKKHNIQVKQIVISRRI